MEQSKMDTKNPHKYKILYTKSNFPDNYADDSFLKDLKKNVNIKIYSTLEVMVEVGVVTHEICSVVIVAVIFHLLDDKRLQPQTLLCLAFTLAIVLYLIHVSHSMSKLGVQNIHDAKLAIIYMVFNFAFSPALKTLTATISSDTVYAMTTATMFLHLVTHDYGCSFSIVSPPLSFNAAIFGVVCLASRLPDLVSTFALLTMSVLMFGLLPHLRCKIDQNSSRFGQIGTTLFMVITATMFLTTVSSLSVFLFYSVVVFINILCPIWFVGLHKYKENLYGPWDEAIL